MYQELQQQINLKNLEIGTKATRPAIIDTLINNRKFISFENNKYTPTELGLNFYNIIKDLDIAQVSQTVIMEYQQKQVALGKLHILDFYSNLQKQVQQIVNSILILQAPNLTGQKQTFG